MADLTGFAVQNFQSMIIAIAGYFLVFLLVFIVVYIYTSLALMKIARKTNTEHAWLAWIPIANIYLMLKIAGMHWWFMLFFFLSIVPIPYLNILSSVIFLIIIFVCLWKIFKAVRRPGWWCLFVIVPIIGWLVYMILLGVAAWKDSNSYDLQEREDIYSSSV